MGVAGFVNRAHVTLKSLNCDGPYGIALGAAWLALLALTVAGPAWQEARHANSPFPACQCRSRGPFRACIGVR